MLKRASFVVICCVVALSGCNTTNPVWDTFTTLPPWKKQFAEIYPGIEYLVVELDGKASVMALGSRETLGEGEFASVDEYWYNGQGEMLHLRNGRIHQALGVTHEIRGQEGKVPAWRDLDRAPRALTWTRQLDVMPSYRYSLKENVLTYRVPAPKTAPKHIDASAVWFVDEVSSTNELNKPWHYKQLFALQLGLVVYSEQCVAQQLCLKIKPLVQAKQQ